MRYPTCAVPDELGGSFSQMGEIGAWPGRSRIVEDRDGEAACTLGGEDAAVNPLHRAVFTARLSAGSTKLERHRVVVQQGRALGPGPKGRARPLPARQAQPRPTARTRARWLNGFGLGFWVAHIG